MNQQEYAVLVLGLIFMVVSILFALKGHLSGAFASLVAGVGLTLFVAFTVQAKTMTVSSLSRTAAVAEKLLHGENLRHGVQVDIYFMRRFASRELGLTAEEADIYLSVTNFFVHLGVVPTNLTSRRVANK